MTTSMDLSPFYMDFESQITFVQKQIIMRAQSQ